MRKETVTPDGVEIVTREIAVVALFGRDTPVETNFNKLLLTDGVETYECDICGYVNTNPFAIPPHYSRHVTDYKSGNAYTKTQLKHIIRVCKQIIEDNGSTYGYATQAMVILTRQGMTNTDGELLTAQAISYLYNKYKDLVHVRTHSRKELLQTNAAHTVSDAEEDEIVETMTNTFSNDIKLILGDITNVRSFLDDIEQRVKDLDTDNTLLEEKSAKYDQLKNLLNL